MNEVYNFLKSECKLPEYDNGIGYPFSISAYKDSYDGKIVGIEISLESEIYYISKRKKYFAIYRMTVVGERPKIRKTLESLKRFILFSILND